MEYFVITRQAGEQVAFELIRFWRKLAGVPKVDPAECTWVARSCPIRETEFGADGLERPIHGWRDKP